MNAPEFALERIQSAGVRPTVLPNGNLYLDRPEGIAPETWGQVVELAKQFKAEILELLSRLDWPEDMTHEADTPANRPNHITPTMLRAWKTARPWILARLPELEAKGWTRRRLFRAGRLRYPHGPWGPAWSRNWLRPGVQIEIEDNGTIRWTWTEATGRITTQAASIEE